MTGSADNEGMRLVIAVFYEGPWERLSTWFFRIDRRTLELRGEVKPGSLRERVATFCELRNRAWRMRYAERRTNPPARWKRRTGR